MKKVFLFAAVAGLFLASCSNDEFFGTTENTSKSNEIGFGMNVPNLTRATIGGKEAAQKLNNNFVVYGFKCEGAEQADGTKQQTVFGRYNVNYIGNDGTSQSNTKGWEYVGYNDLDGKLQTMKYWDYSAESYVFSAISGVGVTPVKTETGTTVYDKGWKVTIPAGGSLSALYASARVPVTKTLGSDKVYKYPETVDLTFYSMGTKVRFGIYETVPGYEIHIDKFYCKDETGAFTSTSNTTTNFGINGKFLTPNVDEETELTVTYYDAASGIENRPKVNFTPDPVKLDKLHSAKFGTNMQAQPKIGETSVTATYDKANGEYTFILPYKIADNNLQLYVDFTLKAPNGETIKVYQAKATVPAAYTQWKENFAYTYLFKISDNTNGTTGTPKDPDDPTKPWDPSDPRDPEGLYSITFDACIVNAEAGLTEEGVQETITSTTTPSITTYAKGTVVTANNEYTAGKVYYSATNNATKAFIHTNKSAVYQVIYNGDAPLTEALIADYSKGNGVVLVPVKTTTATQVPLSDGTKLTFTSGQCKSFEAAAGNNYVVVYTVDGKETFKLVRVAGGAGTTPAYKVTVTPSQKIVDAATDQVTFTLMDANEVANIRGAIPFFQIFNENNVEATEDFTITVGDNKYVVTLKPSAVAKNANGTYTIKFNETTDADETFKVAVSYAVKYNNGSDQFASVVKNGSTHNIFFKVNDVLYPGAKVTDLPVGITVTDLGGGKYQIAATADPGDYTFKLAGKTVKVKVVSYSFNPNAMTITWIEGKAQADVEKVSLQLQKNGTDVTDVNDPFTSTKTSVVANGTISSGVVTADVLDGGETTLKYENAECKVTVNKYELKSSVATIKRATESTKLTYWLNGKQQNAETATVKVKKDDVEITTGYTLTSNGRDLTFGNVAETGTYRIEYCNDAKTIVLGFEVITVN